MHNKQHETHRKIQSQTTAKCTHQVCEDTGYRLEDLKRAMACRDGLWKSKWETETETEMQRETDRQRNRNMEKDRERLEVIRTTKTTWLL